MLELALISKLGMRKFFTDFELVFVSLEISIPNFNPFSKTVRSNRGKTSKKNFCLRPKPYGNNHQSVLNLDCAKIDRENKTLQGIKGKSIEDEANNNNAQKLNTKTETYAVKVQWSNI